MHYGSSDSLHRSPSWLAAEGHLEMRWGQLTGVHKSGEKQSAPHPRGGPKVPGRSTLPSLRRLLEKRDHVAGIVCVSNGT